MRELAVVPCLKNRRGRHFHPRGLSTLYFDEHIRKGIAEEPIHLLYNLRPKNIRDLENFKCLY